MRLIFATNNNHKLNEIKAILPAKYKNLAFSLSDLNISVDPDENGSTYEENANIKSSATYFALRDKNLLSLDDYIIADDTGLSIDYLNGEPGIHSARFLGDILQADKNKKIIDLMKDVSDSERTAHFITKLSVLEINIDKYLTDIPKSMIFEGRVDGYIAKSIIGDDGFGYDPIFAIGNPSDILKGDVKTYSKLCQAKKNLISHRAMAINAFTNYLEKKMKF